MNTKEFDKQYIANTYARNEVVFVKGKGATLYDDKGKSYVDFGSGIAVAGLGHANKKWLSAVTKQAGLLPHVSNLYYSQPMTELARALNQRTGCSKVFFSNSGAEANECAIKCIRKYASDKGRGTDIIVLKNSFHGRTLATLTATGQESLHKYFAPFVQGFRYVDAGNIDALTAAIDENTAGILMELVQGEGGVIPLDKEYVQKVAEIAAAKDILVAFDEVQTGNGRTGTLYAYMQYGVCPDILTTAKGLGNGLPIGATLFFKKTAEVLTAGTHGSTFGGNPVACKGAVAVLEQLDETLLASVRKTSARITEELLSCGKVKSVSGLGLMLGIEVDNAKEVQKECLEKGLVILTAHEKVRLLPPLNISEKELNKGLNILKGVLK